MIVRIQPGEILQVRFTDTIGEDEDDGFEIHFDTKAHPHSIVVKKSDGLAGSIKDAACDILYHENFRSLPLN